MGRCSNEALLKKVGLEKLDKNTEIDFRLRRDLPDCRKIKTKDYKATSAVDALSFNKFKKPVNRFECNRVGCTTSGVLTMNEADETATYRAMFDATEWANGVVTFYVEPDKNLQDADYPITVTLAVGEAIDLADADVYTVTIEKSQVMDDGFAPVLVNLANTPSSVDGNGWTPDSTGAFIRLSADKKVGFSSISIYDSIDDFDLLESVTISCLTTIGGTFDLEVLNQRCQEAKYNDEVQTLNFPVTGTNITPNYLNLFPMAGSGDAKEGFTMTTVEKTIGADGKITLADASQDVCGFITVQVKDSCNVLDATYTMSSANRVTDVDDMHFIVTKNADGSTDIEFNTSQAGVEVLVRYPKRAEVQRRVISADYLNSSQLSMTVPWKLSDGTEMVMVFENVYITSFPLTVVSDGDQSFAFTLAIGRDASGSFGYFDTVVD